MNPHTTLPPIHLLPIYSPSPSSVYTSTSTSSPSPPPSYTFPNDLPCRYSPSAIPQHHHHYDQNHHSYTPSRTEELKTTLEQAKLDQRREEYALLRDALRRGVPYSAIPGLLASRDASVRRRVGYEGYGLGGGFHHQGYGDGDGSGLSAHGYPDTQGQAHGQGQKQGHGQAGVLYYIPAPTDTPPIPPRKRRLDLDDSFLHRAYKRRRPWTSARGRATNQRGERTQRITFHHWVPGVSK